VPAALKAAGELARRGERSADLLLEAAAATLTRSELEAEYLALVDPESLEPLPTLAQPALLALAVRVGEVRLIDNAVLEPVSADTGSQTTREAIA
jgi:pantoate--beta-alanine ligase